MLLFYAYAAYVYITIIISSRIVIVIIVSRLLYAIIDNGIQLTYLF